VEADYTAFCFCLSEEVAIETAGLINVDTAGFLTQKLQAD
jgi:hypothetical protein